MLEMLSQQSSVYITHHMRNRNLWMLNLDTCLLKVLKANTEVKKSN